MRGSQSQRLRENDMRSEIERERDYERWQQLVKFESKLILSTLFNKKTG